MEPEIINQIRSAIIWTLTASAGVSFIWMILGSLTFPTEESMIPTFLGTAFILATAAGVLYYTWPILPIEPQDLAAFAAGLFFYPRTLSERMRDDSTVIFVRFSL